MPARLRTSLFSVLAERIEGARVLDLCAGVGALGLEALSRGAAHVVLVDADRRVVATLARWIESRGVASETRAVVADARRGAWPAGPYDLVFLDPPFPAWDGDARDAHAMLELAADALAPRGVLAAKVPAKAAMPRVASLGELDRRAHGSVAFVLWAKAGTPPAPVKTPDPPPDYPGGTTPERAAPRDPTAPPP
jgi:16S rRNA (guanine(966)-N(2))-methyltransferase RsmD